MQPRTLYDKLWDAHVVSSRAYGNTLLYIDRVILHEVTSAQAFEGLQDEGRPLWRRDSHFAVADHQVPTTSRALGMKGIGSSELEHVMATQCLLQQKCRNLRVEVRGQLPAGVTAKDLALHIIGQLGVAGGTGCAIEYCGEAVRALDMAGRFTLCNMTIEAGARAGLIAYDDVTEAYVLDRPQAPKGAAWTQASAAWRAELHSDDGAHFDRTLNIDANQIAPLVTWGTKPDQVVSINGLIPHPGKASNAVQRADWEKALVYMDLQPGQALAGLPIDQVFIGSCTNSRIEDLRAAAAIARGRQKKVARVLVVPGSGLIKKQAETEGLDKIFIEAGFEWREAGCSMCNAMNPDQLAPGERCASTSNRNFESRQGYKGRTHLVSPAMAAAAAVTGVLTDVRTLNP